MKSNFRIDTERIIVKNRNKDLLPKDFLQPVYCAHHLHISIECKGITQQFPFKKFEVNAYTILTDFPESDGTLKWDSTTMVAVHVSAGDVTGFGYSYAPAATAAFIKSTFTDGSSWLDIAYGEYGYELPYFHRRLEAGAVDVMQADATRCFGISGFMAVANLCEAFRIPLSSHCAPSLHLHVGCAALPFRHGEYFHDHVRIEQMLFDGVASVRNGMLYPDLSRSGMGLELKRKDAEKFEV